MDEDVCAQYDICYFRLLTILILVAIILTYEKYIIKRRVTFRCPPGMFINKTVNNLVIHRFRCRTCSV